MTDSKSAPIELAWGSVLQSSAVLPWQFKEWEDSVENRFRSKGLWEFLSGEKVSEFYNVERPKFGWVLETEVMIRDPSSDVGSIHDAMAAEIDSGDTAPYSHDYDIESSPPAKRSSDARPGYTKKIMRGSPDVRDEELSHILRCAKSEDFYYQRLESYKRDVAKHEKDARIHESDVNKAMDLLLASLSDPVQELLQEFIASRDLSMVWQKLHEYCGPRSGEEGLAALDLYWAGIKMGTTELMTEFLLRIDRTAKSFEAYGPTWKKTEQHKRVLVRNALVGHRLWPEWSYEIRETDKAKEGWTALRSRLTAAAALHQADEILAKSGKGSKGGELKGASTPKANAAAEKALAATPGVQSLLQKARNEERKKAEGDSKSEGGGEPPRRTGGEPPRRTGTLSCFLCGERGHILKECPWQKEFTQYQSSRKGKPSGKSVESASPADGDEDESVCCGVCDDSEPFDDWLSDGDTVGECSSPAVEMCMALMEDPKPRIVDSGCTSSIDASPTNALTNFTKKDEYISLGNSEFKVKSEGRGDLGPLLNTMYAPGMSYSMVSVSAFDKEGHYSIFGGGKCLIVTPSASVELQRVIRSLSPASVVLSATMRNRLYHVDTESCPALSCAASDLALPAADVTARRTLFENPGGDSQEAARTERPAAKRNGSETDIVPYTFAANRKQILGSYGSTRTDSSLGLNDIQRLHLRLAHAPKATLLAGLRSNAFDGAQTTYEACRKQELGLCDSCIRGTMRQETVRPSSRDLTLLKPMQEIGFDQVKLSTVTVNGEMIANLGIDYGSKLLMLYMAKSDSEALQIEVLERVQRDWCTPYGHSIRVFHSDFASVFVGKMFSKHLLAAGILHDCSSPYQHSHNLVEGVCVRVIINRARVLLADSGLSPRFASFAIQAAIDAWNALLHPTTALKTPLELVTGVRPDVSALRPFGSIVYYFNTKEERTMDNDPRWKERASRGVLLGNSKLVAGGYLVYPGKNRKIIHRKQVVALEATATQLLPCYSDRYQLGDPLLASEVPEPAAPPEKAPTTPTTPPSTPPSSPAPRMPPVSTPVGHRHVHATRHAAGIGARAAAVALVCALDTGESEGELAAAAQAEAKALPTNPRSIAEALRGEHSEEWRAALKKERDACIATGSYREVDFVPARAMSAVMAFRVSRNADGTLKFKSRLCPNGSAQVRGIDYDDSFSPTVRKSTLFLFLHVAAAKGWKLLHLDIGNAYKEVPPEHLPVLYMKMSKAVREQGFSKSEYVELAVNYWGTKQAGRLWYAWLGCVLVQYGFERDGDDPCLLYLVHPQSGLVVFFMLYVDDLGVGGDWEDEIDRVVVYLKGIFAEVKVAEFVKFLGMQIERIPAKREIRVHLSDYASETVDELVPSSVEGSATPLHSTVDYRELPHGEEKPIWGAVGKVRFLADSSWWELKVCASLLAIAGATPSKAHRKGMMKCLQYVKLHKSSHFLVLGGTEPIGLTAFADASYTPEGDSRYQYGHVLYLSPSAGAIVAQSRRSTTVSHSSAESEVRSICEACKEIVPTREMLELLRAPQMGATRLFTDSQAAVDLISNIFAMHPKSRHFNRDINYVRQCQQEGLIELIFVPTDLNPADIMTKILGVEKHVRFTAMLLLGVGVAAMAVLAYEGMAL
jgi:hypothetical protein